MTIETKTDQELINLWDTLTAQINKGQTAAGTSGIKVLSQIHMALAKRGYRPHDGVWVKDDDDEPSAEVETESDAKDSKVVETIAKADTEASKVAETVAKADTEASKVAETVAKADTEASKVAETVAKAEDEAKTEVKK